MARQVLGGVGAIIGGVYGGVAGAQWGWAIGSTIGGAIDPQIIKGPSIGDVAQQTSQEGGPIPIVFGMSSPIAGNIIATSAPRIVKTRESQGKGGPKVETESVYRTYALGVCEGPVVDFRRVWRNGTLVYDVSEGSEVDNAAFLEKARFFLGDYEQDPSPDLEVIYGVGTTPAHRGLAYMVMADDDLTDMRGAIPSFIFQISSSAAWAYEDVTEYSPGVWKEVSGAGLLPFNDVHNDYTYLLIGAGAQFTNGTPSGYTWTPAPSGSPSRVQNASYIGVPPWSSGSMPQVVWPGTSPSYVTLSPTDMFDTYAPFLSGALSLAPVRYVLKYDDGGYYNYYEISSSEYVSLASQGALSNANVILTYAVLAGTAVTRDNGSNVEQEGWLFDDYRYPWKTISAIPSGGGSYIPGGMWSVHEIGLSISLILRPPDNPTRPRGAARPPQLSSGYYLVNGVPEEDVDWSNIPLSGATTYKVLLEETTHVIAVNDVLGHPHNVVAINRYRANWQNIGLRTSDPNYNNQEWWEAYYAKEVANGGVAAGLVYGVDYPYTYTTRAASRTVSRGYPAAGTAGPVPLAEVVTAICGRVGLAQIDVSQLTGEVRGFVVTNSYPAYSALAALSEIFLFDPSNYDGVLHFIPRGGNSVATIIESDMLDDDEDIEQQRRSDAIAIPRVLNLNYFDIAGGLNTDKQTSERPGDRRSLGDTSLQTAVLLTADEAAQTVVKNHKILIEDQKGELRFSLPDSWLKLAAADPTIVQWQGRSERCRITQIDTHDGFQTYTLLRDRQSAYTSDVEGIPAAPQTAPPSSTVGPTLIEVLDLPLLRDADDAIGLGYYVAVSGMLAAWQGALVELSYDGGVNYTESSTTRIGTIMGETTSALADHPQEFPDQVHTVTVRIDTPDAELEETDLVGLLNQENYALIGDEVVQFATADQLSSGEWELGYFLRGRLRTHAQSHIVGERFVLLDRATLSFVPASMSDIGRTLTFRATSFGAAMDSGTVTTLVYFADRSQIEFAPGYLTARIDGSDAIVTWQGAGRLGAGASVAHGARFAGYRVEFDDGTTLIEVETAAQELTQDVSTLTTPIEVYVMQLNDLTGAGPSTEVTIE